MQNKSLSYLYIAIITLLLNYQPRFVCMLSANPIQIPSRMSTGFTNLNNEGQRNAVLNYMQLGKDAIEFGYWNTAADCFEKALQGIEIIYANTEMAAQARSLWHEEGGKIFKGEPYERALCYFYRGLTYMHNGEFDNARSCFESGMLQDAFAEEDQHRSDFALLALASGWCAQKMGEEHLSSQSFAELRTIQPNAPIPDMNHNVIFFVETGTSPRKLADGIGHAELVFRRGRIWLDVNTNKKKKFKDTRAQISIDGNAYKNAFPIESIYFQAATRGGRPIDRILEGQVRFKTSTSELGGLFLEMGCEWEDDRSGALMGIGGAVTLFALNAKPHADIRYWKNLPDAIHYLSTHLEPGSHSIKVKFMDKNGDLIANMSKSLNVTVHDYDLPHFVYITGHSQIFCDGTLPPNDIKR